MEPLNLHDIAAKAQETLTAQMAVEALVADHCPQLIKVLNQYKSIANIAYDAHIGRTHIYDIVNRKQTATIDSFRKLYNLYTKYQDQEKQHRIRLQRCNADLEIISQYVTNDINLIDTNGIPYTNNGSRSYKLPPRQLLGIELYHDDPEGVSFIQIVYKAPDDGEGPCRYYVYDESSYVPDDIQTTYENIQSFVADYILKGKLSPRLVSQ